MRQERFTELAKKAISATQRLAMQFQPSQWDVEHILLALLLQQRGLVGDILKELNADVGRIRDQVESALKKVQKVTYQTGQIYATPRTAQLFQRAEAEADRLKDELIATEHLLIAIIMEDKGERKSTRLNSSHSSISYAVFCLKKT